MILFFLAVGEILGGHCEISQSQKDKYCMILLCDTENSQTQRERRMVAVRGWKKRGEE
jgi:hypothetical protein